MSELHHFVTPVQWHHNVTATQFYPGDLRALTDFLQHRYPELTIGVGLNDGMYMPAVKPKSVSASKHANALWVLDNTAFPFSHPTGYHTFTVALITMPSNVWFEWIGYEMQCKSFAMTKIRREEDRDNWYGKWEVQPDRYGKWTVTYKSQIRPGQEVPASYSQRDEARTPHMSWSGVLPDCSVLATTAV